MRTPTRQLSCPIRVLSSAVSTIIQNHTRNLRGVDAAAEQSGWRCCRSSRAMQPCRATCERRRSIVTLHQSAWCFHHIRSSIRIISLQYQVADLFLDTLPFNAGGTASDALWAGLPILTCSGQTYTARMAGSLLNAIGLPELITTTLKTYEQMAIDLATHPEALAVIRHRLAANRLTTPLFDAKLFTRHIEAAYTAMYERHQAGLAPIMFLCQLNKCSRTRLPSVRLIVCP